jgi:hypothetical protein
VATTRATSPTGLGTRTGRVALFAALPPVIERVSGTQHTDTLTARANFAYWTAEAGQASK